MAARAHRRSQSGQAMPSIVAVVSVIAVVAALVAFLARGSDEETAATDAQASAATTQPETPAATGAASPSPTESTRAGRPTKADETKPKAKKRRKQRAEPDTGPPDVYVEVYNNTTISGLAADTAAQLQDGGWQVVGVDNWRGDIPESTVYYPEGMQGEAARLARDLGIDRVRGAVSPMKFDRLTVILTPDAA